MEMRQRNLFVIIVMPTIFLLDTYMALWRARGLFHIYTKDGNRGRWVFFNNKSKKELYMRGKKLYSYAKPRSRFRGRFRDQYVIDEKAYRQKKKETFDSKRFRKQKNRFENFKEQRDYSFWVLQNEANIRII